MRAHLILFVVLLSLIFTLGCIEKKEDVCDTTCDPGYVQKMYPDCSCVLLTCNGTCPTGYTQESYPDCTCVPPECTGTCSDNYVQQPYPDCSCTLIEDNNSDNQTCINTCSENYTQEEYPDCGCIAPCPNTCETWQMQNSYPDCSCENVSCNNTCLINHTQQLYPDCSCLPQMTPAYLIVHGDEYDGKILSVRGAAVLKCILESVPCEPDLAFLADEEDLTAMIYLWPVPSVTKWHTYIFNGTWHYSDTRSTLYYTSYEEVFDTPKLTPSYVLENTNALNGTSIYVTGIADYVNETGSLILREKDNLNVSIEILGCPPTLIEGHEYLIGGAWYETKCAIDEWGPCTQYIHNILYCMFFEEI